MLGRLLILIGLIILIIAVCIMALASSVGNVSSDNSGRIIAPSDSTVQERNNKIPTYNSNVLVFPEGTTDWKAVQNSASSSLDNFYCEIDYEWHQCYPVIEKRP